jgi:hypothetical protein
MLKDTEIKDIQKAVFELIQQGELEDAANVVAPLLEQDPNDAIALNCTTSIWPISIFAGHCKKRST